jgi:hypothetical protein
VIFVGIFIAFIGLYMFWGRREECFDKHGEFSRSRFFFGAIFGTMGIASFFTEDPVVIAIGVLMCIGGFALQRGSFLKK